MSAFRRHEQIAREFLRGIERVRDSFVVHCWTYPAAAGLSLTLNPAMCFKLKREYDVAELYHDTQSNRVFITGYRDKIDDLIAHFESSLKGLEEVEPFSIVSPYPRFNKLVHLGAVSYNMLADLQQQITDECNRQVAPRVSQVRLRAVDPSTDVNLQERALFRVLRCTAEEKDIVSRVAAGRITLLAGSMKFVELPKTQLEIAYLKEEGILAREFPRLLVEFGSKNTTAPAADVRNSGDNRLRATARLTQIKTFKLTATIIHYLYISFQFQLFTRISSLSTIKALIFYAILHEDSLRASNGRLVEVFVAEGTLDSLSLSSYGVDGVVNPANSRLTNHGALAGDIRKKAGAEELDKLSKVISNLLYVLHIYNVFENDLT